MSRFYYILLLSLAIFLPLIGFSQPSVLVGNRPSWATQVNLYNGASPSRDIKDGYFLRHLENQSNVDLQEQYTRVVREIVSDAGVQNGSEISVIFDPNYEKITFNSITVWRKGVALNRLDLKKFKIIAEEQDLSRFIYQGTYNAYLVIDDIRKGDRIEYSFTRKGRNPIFGGKYFSFFRLQESTPVSHHYTSIVYSASRKLNFKNFNTTVKPKVSSSGTLLHYVWESYRQKALKYEEDTPSWFTIAPLVQITEFNNWSEVAKWAASVNPVNSPLNGAAAIFVRNLKSKHQNDKEALFRAATQFVQDEVRYMGIEMGQYSHRANDPTKVFNQRYGDCKDKSLLLVSILRAAGIFDAHLALVSTSDRDKLLNYLPSPDLFDHVIVCASVNGKKVWVDPTISYQGGSGINFSTPSYKKALIAEQNTKTLTDVSSTLKGSYSATEYFRITSIENDAELEVETVYTLGEADYIRATFAGKSIEELEKDYLNYYAQTYPKIKASDTLVIRDDKVKNEIIVLEKYTIPSYFTRDSITGTLNATYNANFINNAFPKLKPERRHPLYINSSTIHQTIKVEMPTGWNIDDVEKEVKNPIFNFHSTVSSTDNTLTLHYELENFKDFVTVEEYKYYLKDVKQIQENYLSYPTVYLSPQRAFYPNYWLLAFGGFLIIFFFILGYYYYIRKTNFPYQEELPLPLGGWLIIIMLLLAGTAYTRVIEIIENKYFDLNTWEFHSARSTNVFYKLLLIIKLTTGLYMSFLTTYCLFLMIKKRDILPKAISFYFASATGLLLLVYILSRIFYGQEEIPFSSVVYFAFFAAVNIQYFKLSERVRDTFILPAAVYDDDNDENDSDTKSKELFETKNSPSEVSSDVSDAVIPKS